MYDYKNDRLYYESAKNEGNCYWMDDLDLLTNNLS